jgi:UDP-2,4-diacetamido-2,4,6-trideoxy-beta-L-altropyranose hydrolase
MTPRTLLIRADANIAMGTGHVMRCLALAQAWQDAGGLAVFAMAETTPALRARLLAESCEVLNISARAGTPADAQQTTAFAQEKCAEWIVVDGYQFLGTYQVALHSPRVKVLAIDDYGHAGRYAADLVLNQNVSASESLYPDRGVETRLLLGTRYCLLRREFRAWRNHDLKSGRKIPEVGSRILITLGGSDPENVTARMLQSLAAIKVNNLEATVVIGGSNPHAESLQRSAKEIEERAGIKLSLRSDVANMPELMAWADVAISAAGSTCWELALLGLPALLIDVAENQAAVARELYRLGCAIHLGSSREVSAEHVARELTRLLNDAPRRQLLAQRSQALVDGFGAERVVSVLCRDDGMWLRQAQEHDAKLLWEWANDATVRAMAFSSQPIPWETHVAWLSSHLRGGKCFLLIAEDANGTPLGQIRFDIVNDGDCVVDVSLAQGNRGKGLAAKLIKLGVEKMFEQGGCSLVHAYVKPENAASARAFEKAGFARIGDEQVRGNAAVHFIYKRDANG